MKLHYRKAFGLLMAGLMAGTALADGELTLGRFFTDHMVLQRDKPLVVSGSAKAGATVEVAFAGQKKTAAADENGFWTVTLDALPANVKPQSLTASAAGQKVSLANVFIGDVLLFARQTSVDISVGANPKLSQAIAKDKLAPQFRAIAIRTLPAAEPQRDLAAAATDGWKVIDAQTALGLSGAAYGLGRDLAAAQQVPVGIIDLNLGPAFPISWLSREALLETEKFYGKTDVDGLLKRMERLAELDARGEPMPEREDIRSAPLTYPLYPAAGYNAVLHPLRGVALKAILVQLGNDYPYVIYAELERTGKQFDRTELNRAYVQTYDIRKVGSRTEPVTTPRIPREWRKVFGGGDLPIGLIVPPGSDLHTLGLHHSEMRELQRLMALDNPGVGIILPGSENVPMSAQPADESLLGARCLSWVKSAVYQEPDVPATGPLFARLETDLNRATVHFKEGTAKGLGAKGDALAYFEAAGVEGDYAPAKAVIDGESIRLTCDTVNRIVRVRYNWNNRPNQGLVNAAGLPAIPFRSEKTVYQWFLTNEDSDLPIEYHTPANEWAKSDVTLVNGQMKTHGYDNFSGWLGPLGVMTGPFGPNMGVRKVKAGSPAEGKLLEGDILYSANGKMLGEKAWEVMADAITQSEAEEGKGRLVLGLRRAGKNLDVVLTLKVMGAFSSTAPYDCPKTDRIIKDLEDWVVANGAGAGFLNTDALFMLATGNPELQGYVRRIVYTIMEGRDPASPIDPTKAGKSWQNSAEAILLGEYYLATGDRNALPYLKHVCGRLAATQNKQEGGWRHNFPGGPTYGLIPNAGLPGVMGMYFATTAGLDIDMASYRLGVDHFRDRRAETGYLIYGFGGCQRPVPVPFDPEAFETGHLDSYNGGLSAAGILMRFTENYRAAHLCSLISAYAWNNTFGGHGGNFWNNFWTPLGSHDHGKKAFVHFWENYRWYRELNRMYDGSIIQHEDGRAAAGCGVALVAPRERIQIVGAPSSPFATNAPAFLKPAVDAYWKKDYAGCAKQVDALLGSGQVGKDDLRTVEYLARAAREIQASIAIDLARMKQLCQAGDPAQAKTFIAELKGILPAGDERLVAIEQEIAATKPLATAGTGGKKTAATNPADDIVDADDAAKKAEAAAIAAEKAAAAAVPPRKWDCLVTEIATAKSKDGPGKVPPEQASLWRLKVVEAPSQAPDGWVKPGFDESAWGETHLPISWRMYHTALLRTTFTVADKNAFDGLRFRGWLFRQQGIEIYLNGELVGKVNNLEQKTGNVDAEFEESALKHLKNGENTLAVSTRHNWRWGMLSMNVYNDGFGFRLDARVK